MTPYYQEDGITIYHGSALVVMDAWEGLRTHAFDLLLTDPPYGIGEARGKNVSRGGPFGGRVAGQLQKVIPAVDYGTASWDDRPAHEAIALAVRLCRWQIIFGGNYYHLGPTKCWLVWDKDRTCDFADCELAWTNLNQAVRKFRYRWNGMLQEPHCPRELREHPTQKPEPVMRWALLQAPTATTVLDPFMGIGSTLVAAKRLGRQATGIERDERYCEIAAERLAQRALPFGMGA